HSFSNLHRSGLQCYLRHPPVMTYAFSPVFFLFLMDRPPPQTTLFPYTTLFRSAEIRRAYEAGPEAVTHLAERFSVPAGRIYRRADRKSTRLNSSHVKISYAVFCLKKKRK